jgi:hypothetical protein
MKKPILFLLLILIISDLTAQSKLKPVKSFPDLNSKKKEEFVKSIAGVEFYKNRYFVIDQEGNCLKIFDKDGKYIKQISRKGRGPGELIYPGPFTIDKTKGIIYVNDQGNKRISLYDENGKYLNSINIPEQIIDFTPIGENILIASVNPAKKTIYNLKNKDGKTIKESGTFYVKEIADSKYGYLLFSYNNICVNNDSVYVVNSIMPFMQVLTKDGEVKRTVKFSNSILANHYNENLDGIRKFAGPSRKTAVRVPISSWLVGSSVYNNKVYCFSNLLEKSVLYVFDLKGNNIEKIEFPKELNYKETKSFFLLTIIDGNFYFADHANGQIKIFKLDR